MSSACLLCGVETDNVYNAMVLCESCVSSSVGAERALDATRERRYLAPDQVAELLFIGGVESMADREQLARDTGVRDAVVAAGKQLGGGYFAVEMQLDDSLSLSLSCSCMLITASCLCAFMSTSLRACMLIAASSLCVSLLMLITVSSLVRQFPSLFLVRFGRGRRLSNTTGLILINII